jgi:ribosomal-protein-alanine N-acetyltransferase
MDTDATTLIGTVHLRVLRDSDAGLLGAAYQLNRDHLAPWEPARSDAFFTTAGQGEAIEAKLALHAAGGGRSHG